MLKGKFSKIGVIIIFFLFFLFSFNQKSLAASNSVLTKSEYSQKPLNEVDSKLESIINFLNCELAGKKVVGCSTTKSQGAIFAMTNLIQTTFNIPISSGQYALYLLNNFGLTKKAYADPPALSGNNSKDANTQNLSGFIQLQPILAIWKAARNLVYLIFILIFILIGLGIMFRLKLDPRTVMTVQNQIPKIVVGLILVTFSYAIAGFLVDMMWVLVYLFYTLINSLHISGVDLSGISFSSLQSTSPIGAPDLLMGMGITSIAGRSAAAIGSVVGDFWGGFITFLISGGIATLIVWIAVLWSLFRLWFQLIYNFIMVLVDVIIAPFWIAMGILPGSKSGFGGWFRDLAASLSVYPTTFVMFLLGRVLIGAFRSNNGFVPPLIGFNINEAFSTLIGLGVIFSLPSVVELVRQALKAPPLKIPPSVGQAIGAGSAAPGRLVGGAVQTGFAPHYVEGKGLVYPGSALGRVLRGFGLVK